MPPPSPRPSFCTRASDAATSDGKAAYNILKEVEHFSLFEGIQVHANFTNDGVNVPPLVRNLQPQDPLIAFLVMPRAVFVPNWVELLVTESLDLSLSKKSHLWNRGRKVLLLPVNAAYERGSVP